MGLFKHSPFRETINKGRSEKRRREREVREREEKHSTFIPSLYV